MTNHNRKIGIFVLVVVAIMIIGYFSFSALRGGISSKQTKLTIGIPSTNPYLAPLFVAESKGFFKDGELDLKIANLGSGPTALTAMLETGSPDIVVVANLPVVFKSFVSDEFAIFVGYGRNSEFNQLLAREDRGIKVPADLKGKNIGTIKKGAGHYFLGRFLKANQLNLSDVNIVDFQKTVDVPKALIDGQVEAISVPTSEALNTKKALGINALVLSSTGIGNENFYFVSRKDFLENNQDVLIKFLKSLEKGNQFLKEHPLESIDIVSNKSGLDKIALIAQWDDYEFDLYLDQAILTSLKEQANWALENKLVQGDMIPDYRNYVYDEILRTVKPETVKLDK